MIKHPVHNGIEYGLMAAYAEGLNILRNANVGKRTHDSVVASWLLDLTAAALVDDADLTGFSGRVSDSGEGRWTALAAIDEGVPIPVISAALHERFTSRGNADYANRVLSAMRKQFGGHDEKKDGR